MSQEPAQSELADFIDADLSGPQWEAWSAANPELADELVLASRVRLLLRRMAAANIVAPAGFEARLMERIRQERTLLELLELALSGMGVALIELLNVLFAMLPESRQSQVAPG